MDVLSAPGSSMFFFDRVARLMNKKETGKRIKLMVKMGRNEKIKHNIYIQYGH